MLTPIQERLLDMLSWLHNFCVDNDIDYYVVGGTMIGAARHKGFIPWDDDIDVALPRPDYEKFIDLMKSVNGKYYLETPYNSNSDYLYTYAKLYDTTTTLIENIKSKCKRGLYIDVFPLDGLGSNDEDVDANFKKVDMLNMFLMTRTCMVNRERSLYKNVAILLSRLIPQFIVNDKKLSIRVDKLASSFGYNNSSYVANLMGAYRKKEVMPKEFFGTPTLYPFENIEVYGVEQYDKFLIHLYKNWRELPPEDKRKGAHDYLSYDLSKPYLED